MQIIDNKALLITTKKAKEIVSLIPKSRLLEERGDVGQVLVYWGYEEAKILRNLRIKNVPHPILREYKWPGIYRPMAHQKVTAAFAVSHRRCYILNEMGCVDADTEYLSPTGWKRIADYEQGSVAQYDPDTGCIQFVEPTEYVKKPCDSMIRFKTSRGVDQLLSPEHRVLYVDAGGTPKVAQAWEVLASHQTNARGWKGRIITTFTPPDSTGMHIDDAQIRLQVAVMADGYFPSTTNRVHVRLKKPRKILRLRQLLTAAGIPFTERDVQPEGFKTFTFYAPLRSKSFAALGWGWSPSQLEIIASEVGYWDGSYRKAGAIEFFTTIKEDADFIQYVFSATGRTARITVDERDGRKALYCVHARNKAALLYVCGQRDDGTKVETIYQEPSTDGYKYCFMVPSTFLLLRRNGCIFATGNTGKSMSVAWAADYLLTKGLIKRVLVLCPLSIMESAWQTDLFRSIMHRTVGIAYGSREARAKVIAGHYEFVIMNHDGIKIMQNEIAAAKFDLIIVDELNCYKTATSNRSAALQAIIKPDTWVWGMTGSPAAHSPVDAYGLAKIVRPDSVPRYFGRFRDMVMNKITQFKYVPKANATETVFSILQPAIRFTKAECLDLPERTYISEHIGMTKQQETYYNKIKAQGAVMAAGTTITAVNAAALMNKLVQISCGSVYDVEGDTLEFDIKPKYARLKELIEESVNKVIVFAPYQHVITRLMEALIHDGITAGRIAGDVSLGQRTDLFKRFQTEGDPKVLVIQPQAAAHGVTLTRADTVIWWGPTTSTETYIQANDRAHRQGQKNKVTVVHLFSSTVEQRMFKMLQNNIDVHNSLVELYKQEVVD